MCPLTKCSTFTFSSDIRHILPTYKIGNIASFFSLFWSISTSTNFAMTKTKYQRLKSKYGIFAKTRILKINK